MYNYIDKYSLLLIISGIISGCNGSSSDSSDIDSSIQRKKISINAQSSLSFGQTKSTEIIDLRQRVKSANNQPLIIGRVDSLDDNCEIVGVDSLTFQVQTYDSSVCRFKYSVKPASSEFSGEASDISQLVVNDDLEHDQYLPPVSRTMKPLSKIVLDDASLLIEEGYEIVTDSLELIGDTESGDIGSLTDVTEKGFTYTAPDTQGIVRIFYTEKNKNLNNVKSGVVYIAIGQNENTSPIVEDHVLEKSYIVDGERTVNITSYVQDLDGDDIQLIDTQSFLGKTTITSEDTFSYKPVNVGTEYIVYTVSDHNGGYGIGTLSFGVNTYRSIVDKERNLEFLPPDTLSSLSNIDSYSGLVHENGTAGIDGDYPSFANNLAEAYCYSRGARLPVLSELQNMRSDILNNQSIYETSFRWHSSADYLLSSGQGGFSLRNGEISSETVGYFSCVRKLLYDNWKFLSNVYRGYLGEIITVYIGATEGDATIPMAVDDYKLSTQVDKLLIRGVVDPKPEDYLDISILQNKIIVKLKKEVDPDDVSLLLIVNDEAAGNSTNIYYGVSVCEEGVTPDESATIKCIRVVTEKTTNLKFTLTMSDAVLSALNIPMDALDDFPYVGSADLKWRYLQWGLTTDELRDRRNSVLTHACQTMNELKIDNRSNWAALANLTRRTGKTGSAFYLEGRDAEDTYSHTHYMRDVDGGTLGDGSAGYYGQGFATMPINGAPGMVNQVGDTDQYYYYFLDSTGGGAPKQAQWMTCVSLDNEIINNWTFTSETYTGVFDKATEVIISGTTGDDDWATVYKPLDDYDLSAQVNKLAVRGVSDPQPEDYLAISISQNRITVNLHDSVDPSDISLFLTINDKSKIKSTSIHYGTFEN
ncbi:hypothetical protein IHC93_17220 [Photobacterium damselae subsp. damselae]|uniref:Ig-like domain-containing protein n=1 Tax=Photobacterium damselae TaxID=38293 RepID=UPI001F37EF8E|nr:hypothetical protein [Photobacterium damselae]UKA27754.1 hypothetical protein IHC93_17220 [Photobacterium damselae subsp. damselae]